MDDLVFVEYGNRGNKMEKMHENNTLKRLFVCLLFAACSLVLYSVFAVDRNCGNGIVMGKIFFFHRAMTVFSVIALVVLLIVPKIKVPFSTVDLLIILIASLVVATYDYQLNPDPVKLLFCGQIVVLWFLLRIIFSNFPRLKIGAFLIFVTTASIESIIGLRQLYNYDTSLHSLFKMTGTFYNPGPYSGYLAVIMPVCISLAIYFNKIWRFFRSYKRIVCAGLYYFSLLSALLVIVVLPAAMGRSAWIAAMVGCLFVFFFQIGIVPLRHRISHIIPILFTNKKFFFVGLVGTSAVAIAFAVLAFYGIYHIKEDSAYGRLLIWKITAKTIEKHTEGVGLGGFSSAYSETQADYFLSGKATEHEKYVAGCPEYAFNEYLQFGAEIGVVGMLMFILLIMYCIFYGIRHSQYAAVGGLLALAIFAVFSYPLQLPSFWIVFTFMGCMSVTDTKNKYCRKGNVCCKFFIVPSLCAASIILCVRQSMSKEAYIKWNKVQMLYNTKAYNSASDGYMEIYSHLSYQAQFLFEGAQCYNKIGDFSKAKEWLKRAACLSGDPMILYMIAKNEQALGNYSEAERILLHSIDVLPERIYPYFLLTKLYCEQKYYQPEKLKNAANTVLTKEPKVNSTAIQEMRDEVRKIIIQNSSEK